MGLRWRGAFVEFLEELGGVGGVDQGDLTGDIFAFVTLERTCDMPLEVVEMFEFIAFFLPLLDIVFAEASLAMLPGFLKESGRFVLGYGKQKDLIACSLSAFTSALKSCSDIVESCSDCGSQGVFPSLVCREVWADGVVLALEEAAEAKFLKHFADAADGESYDIEIATVNALHK